MGHVCEVRDCLNCEERLAIYCGKCVDAEREELNRLRRLVPTGTYTLNVAHEEEIQRLRDQADEWRLKAADYSNRMDEWKLKEGEARDLLRAVATACRSLGPRTDAVMSVVGNALAELDEAKAAICLVLKADCLKSHAFERGDDDASVYDLLKSVVRK